MRKTSTAMFKNYLISYQMNDDRHRVYDARTHTCSTMDTLPHDINKFKMLKVEGCDNSDEGLKKYAKLFMQWNRELRFDEQCSFLYSEQCWTDCIAVTRFFNRKCNYDDHAPITPTEYKWFEKCANYGIQYLKKKDYTRTGYGYDFKNQYGLVMNMDIMIPTKDGKEVTLTELPDIKKLKQGFYAVKIITNDDNFRKAFAFSSHNVYVMDNLKFAMEHQKQFNIKFELCKGENNAYLYDDKDLVSLKTITDQWFSDLKGLKERYPKNKLVKHLFSTAWSSVNAGNTKYYEEDELRKLDVGITMDDEYMIMEYHESFSETKKPYWEVMNTKRPYKYNIRLKPWITGVARNLTASVVMQDIDNVIRVATDGVVFKKEQKFDNPYLVLEDKTTGKILWVNNGCYYNKTTGYKTKNYKD
jgi:hypothetical protein